MAATTTTEFQIPVTFYFDVNTNSFTDPNLIYQFLADQIKTNYASAVTPGSKFTINNCKTQPHG